MLEELDKSLKEFREQQRELRKKVFHIKVPNLLLYAPCVCVCLQYLIMNIGVLFYSVVVGGHSTACIQA